MSFHVTETKMTVMENNTNCSCLPAVMAKIFLVFSKVLCRGIKMYLYRHGFKCVHANIVFMDLSFNLGVLDKKS